MGIRKEPTPELLEALRTLPDAEIARRYRISRNTLRRWRVEYKVENPYLEPYGEYAGRVSGHREKESAVLLASDLHYGKRTSSFDTDVLRRRMDALIPRLQRIHDLLSTSYDIEELVVCILGDVNDGSDIYPTQAHHQEVSDPLRQAWEAAAYLAGWLRQLKRAWRSVRVEAIAGNHGRAGKRVAESASWDLACYHYLALHLERDGIPVSYAQEGLDPFLRMVTVRKHRFLLYHGHGVRMYQGVPWYGLAQRVLRWRAVMGEFAALCCGHFHAYGDMDIAGTRVLLTGTPVTDDSWVLQVLGGQNANRWHLFGVGDRRPITWQFGLELVGE
jgi:predicted phosphodiesterase